jgi:hypothetical protein
MSPKPASTAAMLKRNFRLPWLSLLAQLPYEAEGTRDNLMSCILGKYGDPRPVLAAETATLKQLSAVPRYSHTLSLLLPLTVGRSEYAFKDSSTVKLSESETMYLSWRRDWNMHASYFRKRCSRSSHASFNHSEADRKLRCPLRLTNESGWLSSLILLPQNTRFWVSATTRDNS